MSAESNKTLPGIIVAVLPFQNLSENGELDYFSQGFTEDLIMDLSRFNALQIISFHSTRHLDPSSNTYLEDARSLNTDYIVQGSFRSHSGSVKISTQLIQANDQHIIWAERYDDNIESIFHVQDEIIQRVVNTIQKQININLLSATHRIKDPNLKAYDYFLKGMSQLEKGTLEADEEARSLFKKSLDIEPDYARAYTGLSLSYFNEWSCRLWERWDESQQGAYKYAQNAIALDESDYISNAVLGRIYLYKGETEKAEHFLRKSLRLNGNDADTLIQIASCFTYLGYLEESEKLYLKAMCLNPVNAEWYHAYGSFIQFELGQFEKCIELGLKVDFDAVWVDLPGYIAAAYFMLGDLEKMHHYWNIFEENHREKILQGAKSERGKALQWMVNINPYKVQSHIASFWEYLKEEEHSIPTANKGPVPEEQIQMNTFRKGTGLWEMSFEKKSVYLPDLKGFHDLALMLHNPDKKYHCSELMGIPVRQEDHPEVLDEKAIESYKRRLQDLTLEIEEANANNDSVNTHLLQEEYDKLIDHLSSTMGLGGKSRKLDSPVERARSAVTWRIRSAIRKIEEAHKPLSKHLSNSIETGTFCSYSPEKSTTWVN